MVKLNLSGGGTYGPAEAPVDVGLDAQGHPTRDGKIVQSAMCEFPKNEEAAQKCLKITPDRGVGAPVMDKVQATFLPGGSVVPHDLGRISISTGGAPFYLSIAAPPNAKDETTWILGDASTPPVKLRVTVTRKSS